MSIPSAGTFIGLGLVCIIGREIAHAVLPVVQLFCVESSIARPSFSSRYINKQYSRDLLKFPTVRRNLFHAALLEWLEKKAKMSAKCVAASWKRRETIVWSYQLSKTALIVSPYSLS